MKTFVRMTILVFLVFLTGYILIKHWSFIFARTVEGRVYNIERVSTPVALLGGTTGSPSAKSVEMQNQALYSFAIAIRQHDGEIEIVTASSEDRQWQIVEKGQCVKAKFYVYPPWDFESSGTYFNARLLKQFDCPQP
jgi:hypothetical protein